MVLGTNFLFILFSPVIFCWKFLISLAGLRIAKVQKENCWCIISQLLGWDERDLVHLFFYLVLFVFKSFKAGWAHLIFRFLLSVFSLVCLWSFFFNREMKSELIDHSWLYAYSGVGATRHICIVNNIVFMSINNNYCLMCSFPDLHMTA